jgi:hypothetical protein
MSLFLRSLPVGLLVLLAPSCKTTSGGVVRDEAAEKGIVPGEALVTAIPAPSPEALAQGAKLEDLLVMEVKPLFGHVHRVKFVRLVKGFPRPPDAAYTLKVVELFRSLPGISSCAPNAIAKPAEKEPPKAGAASQ